MRVDCPVENCEDQFVEFTDIWSRKDLRKVNESKGDEYFSFLISKITALHVVTVNGDVLDVPADLTEDFIDDMQWEVFQWFSAAPSLALRRVMNLGEATRRLLFVSPESPQTPQAPTPL